MAALFDHLVNALMNSRRCIQAHFKKPDRNHKHCERYRIVLKPILI
jgi:hypothetical protein